jgi:transcriptional regulator with GAF, ATPase, and Fis domain
MAKRRKKRTSAAAPRPRRSTPRRSRPSRGPDGEKKTVAVLTRELDRARQQLSEALEQQTATSEVLQVISSSPGELEPVFQTMLENATRICDAKFGTMFRFDGEAFRPMAMVNTPPALTSFLQRRGRFVPDTGNGLHQVWTSKKLLHTLDDAASPVPTAPSRLAGARTYLGVPMLKGDELIGIIVIYRQEVRPFTDKQIDLVKNAPTRQYCADRERPHALRCRARLPARFSRLHAFSGPEG